MKMFSKLLLLLAAASLLPTIALPAIPYNSDPDWQSNETGYNDVSTGGFLGDVNGDGWLDFVVGNGNDMQSQRDCIYFNNSGTLETAASWRTSDYDYTGHIDMGDLNNDGWLDLVTAIFWNSSDDSSAYQDQVYLNTAGTLSSSPTFYTNEYDNTFGVALGDYDNDGYLDIGLAQGNRYVSGHQYKILLYHNDGDGTFTKGWESDDLYYANDIEFGDFNQDGWLDIAVANDLEKNVVFYNNGGTFSGTPDWQSTEERGSLQLDIGDINGDGWLDLIVADNEQISGYESKIRGYINNAGVLENTASWVSEPSGKHYYSVAVLADCDNDGYNELATCGWWEPLEIYDNVDGTLQTTPSWTYSGEDVYTLVGEDIIFGDINKDGIHSATDSFSGDGSRQLFYLPRHQLFSIDQVRVNGSIVPISDYCYELQHGWLVLKNAPPTGSDNLAVDYTYSTRLDMAYTNWTASASNDMWYNNGDNPVRLLYFTAAPDSRGVLLSWKVDEQGDQTFLGYNLYRQKLYGSQKDISPTKDNIGYSAPEKLNQELIRGGGACEYLDADTEVSGRYLYTLEAVYASGKETLGSAEGLSGLGKESFYLSACYPNPSSGKVTFNFSLGAGVASGELTIYDLSGRLVAEFPLSGGQNELVWDGCSREGKALASGVYIYSLVTSSDHSARELVITH
jgi:hypothetical protein